MSQTAEQMLTTLVQRVEAMSDKQNEMSDKQTPIHNDIQEVKRLWES